MITVLTVDEIVRTQYCIRSEFTGQQCNMCESVATDLEDTEFVQTKTTKTVDKKVHQHSDVGDLAESSSDNDDILDSVSSNQPRVEDLDDSDCGASTTSPLRGHDPETGEVDDQPGRSTTKGLENSSPVPVPDGVLEQVADRLRIIGDEMDSDIRRRNRMFGRRHNAGVPFHGFDVIVDLFPEQSTSRKNLTVVGDLARETLARDLVHVTVRRVLVAAGSAFARSLFRELISSTVTCPVDFRLRWSTIKWKR